MAWARISDDFHDHPKIADLTVDAEGLAALGLWTLALAWVRADRRRGGVIPIGMAMRFAAGGGKQLASRLVQVGLWDETAGGYRFHDFEDVYTPEDLSSKRAEAGRRGGLASGKTRQAKAQESKVEAKSKQSASFREAKQPEASRTRAGATTHYPEASKEASTARGSFSAQGRNAREPEPPPSDEPPSVVESLLTDYRENSPRGIPSRLAAKLAAEIHQLVRDGFHPDHIREGLWQLRLRKLGPAVLPSLVDEIANRPLSNVVALPGVDAGLAVRPGPTSRRQSATDRAVAEGLALVEELSGA